MNQLQYVDPVRLNTLLGGSLPPEGLDRYYGLVREVRKLDPSAEIRASTMSEIKRLEGVLEALLLRKKVEDEQAPLVEANRPLTALYNLYMAAYRSIVALQDDMRKNQRWMALIDIGENDYIAPTSEKSPYVSKVEDAESAIVRFTEKTESIKARLAELESRVGKLLKAEPAERLLLVCEHLSRKIKPLQDALTRGLSNPI